MNTAKQSLPPQPAPKQWWYYQGAEVEIEIIDEEEPRLQTPLRSVEQKAA